MYCDYFLEYTNFKDDLMEYKCLNCNKRYRQKFNEKLKERFFDTCKFSKTISLFYHYNRYVSSRIYGWLGKFNEATFPEKEDFYSLLIKYGRYY